MQSDPGSVRHGEADLRENLKGIDVYVLSQQDARYALKAAHDEEIENVAAFEPRTETGFTMANGVKVQVERFPSALSLMGRDGCACTRAAYAVLLAGGEADRHIAWRTPKFQRGALAFTAADLNGDGAMELIVTAGRNCGGVGQVFVYRQSAE